MQLIIVLRDQDRLSRVSRDRIFRNQSRFQQNAFDFAVEGFNSDPAAAQRCEDAKSFQVCQRGGGSFFRGDIGESGHDCLGQPGRQRRPVVNLV